MGNKQKTKYTKRGLRRLRKKILQDYRQKKKPDGEVNPLRNSPSRQLAESNRDVPKDPLSSVFDIKVEEPEVTSRVEGDYPYILLDHSYSRAPVKDELEWFSEYQHSLATTSSSSNRTQNRAPIPLSQTTNCDRMLVNEVSPVIFDSERSISADDPGTSGSFPPVSIKIESASDEEDNLDLQNVPQRDTFVETSNTGGFSFQKEHNYTRPCPVDFESENSFTAKSEDAIEQGTALIKQSNHPARRSLLKPTPSISEDNNCKPKRRRRGKKKLGDSTRRSLRLLRPKTDLEIQEQSEHQPVFVLKFANPSDIDILTKASQEQNDICPNLSAIRDPDIGPADALNHTEIRAKIISPSALPDPEILRVVPSIPSIMLSKKNVVTSCGNESEAPKHLASVNNEEAVENPKTDKLFAPVIRPEKPRIIRGKSAKRFEKSVAPKTYTKPVKIADKQDAPKKSTAGTLRVKTQDELNALAAPLVSHAGKMFVVLPQNALLPINRCLAPVPQKWKEKFIDSQRNIVEADPASLLIDTKLSKDITGKRIKNTRKEKSTENLLDGDGESRRRSPRISGIEQGGRTTPVDIESLLSRFIVTHPVDQNEFTAVRKRKTRRAKPLIYEIRNDKVPLSVDHLEVIQKHIKLQERKSRGRFKIATPEKPIVERVDSIIKDVLAGTDDIEEVDVLRVNLKNDDFIVPPAEEERDKIKDIQKTESLQSFEALSQSGTDLYKTDQPEGRKIAAKRIPKYTVLKKTFKLPILSKSSQKIRASVLKKSQNLQTVGKTPQSSTAIVNPNLCSCVSNHLAANAHQGTKSISEANNVKDLRVKIQVRNATKINKVKKLNANNPVEQDIDKNSKDMNKIEDNGTTSVCPEYFIQNQDSEHKNPSDRPKVDSLAETSNKFIEGSSLELHQIEDQTKNIGSTSLGVISDSQTEHSLPILDAATGEFSFPQIRLQDLEDVLGPSATDEELPNRDSARSLMETPNNKVEKRGSSAQSDKSSISNKVRKRKSKQDLTKKDEEVPARAVEGPRSTRKEPVVIDVEKSKILDEEIDSDYNDNGNNDDSDSSFTAEISPIDSPNDRSLRRSPRIRMQISKPKPPANDEIVVEYPAHEQEDEQETVFTEVTEVHNAELFAHKRFCHYCQKPCPNFYVHLQEFHYKEWEVKKFLKAAKGSPSRRTTLKKWYLLECYANAFEQKDHLSCANCLTIVHKSTAFFHYIRCAARRKKRDPVIIPEEDIFENLSRLTVAVKAEFSPKSWSDLAKCLLVSLYVLNDRVPSVESLLISDYNKGRTFNSKTDMELAEIVDDTHKVKYFMLNDVSLKVVIQRNFIGMPIFLTSMQDGVVSLLLKYRIEAEVPLDNDYVFGCSAQEVNDTRLSLTDAIRDYVRDIHQKETPISTTLGAQASGSTVAEKDEEGFGFTSFDPLLWEPSVRLIRTDFAEKLLRLTDETDECSIEIKNELPEMVEDEASAAEDLEKELVASNDVPPTLVKVENETADAIIPDEIPKDLSACPNDIQEISTITSATTPSEAVVNVSDNKTQDKIIVRLPSSRLLSKRKKTNKKNKRKKWKIKDLVLPSKSKSLEENDDHSDHGEDVGGTKSPAMNPSDISPPSKISTRDDQNINEGVPITKAILYPLSSSSKKKYTIKNIKILPLKPRPPQEASNFDPNPASLSNPGGNDGSDFDENISTHLPNISDQSIIRRRKSTTSAVYESVSRSDAAKDSNLPAQSTIGRRLSTFTSSESAEDDVAFRSDKFESNLSSQNISGRRKSAITRLKSAEDDVAPTLDKLEAAGSNLTSQNVIGRRKSSITCFKSAEEDVASKFDKFELPESNFPPQNISGRRKSAINRLKSGEDDVAPSLDKLEAARSNLTPQNVIGRRKSSITGFKGAEGDVASKLEKFELPESNFPPQNISGRRKSAITRLKSAEDDVASRLDKLEASGSSLSPQNISSRRRRSTITTRLKDAKDDVASRLDKLEASESNIPRQNISSRRRRSTITRVKSAEGDVASRLDELEASGTSNLPTQNIIGRRNLKSAEDDVAFRLDELEATGLSLPTQNVVGKSKSTITCNKSAENDASSPRDDKLIEYPAAKRKKLTESQKSMAGPSSSKSWEDGSGSPEKRFRNADTHLPRSETKMRKEAVPKRSEMKTKMKEAKGIINDVYKCFYLETDETRKRTKRILDIRDLRSCGNCKKYFLRACFLKHRRWCLGRRVSRGTKTEKHVGKHRKHEEAQSKHRSLKTLQSPGGAKKYFCIFCKQTFTKLTRHLEHVHKEEEEVKEMLKHPKRSSERERILYRLRTKGTFAFNVNAEYNGGRIIVSRRPNATLQRTTRDFLPCPHCRNYFAKKTLYRHTRRCSNMDGRQKGLRRTALALISSSHPRCNKTMAAQIIPRLVDDKVSEIIKKDELLILLGNHLTRKHPASKCKGYYIRQNLRTAGKFFLALKSSIEGVCEFASIYNLDNCDAVLDALKTVAGYDVEKKQFKLPEIARKLDRIIKIAGEIWSMECSKNKRFEDRHKAAEFLRKFTQRCKKEVLPLLSRPKQRCNNDDSVSKEMFQFSKRGMIQRAEALKRDFSFETWNELANYLLVYLRLLNDNIQDGASLYFSDYLQRHSLDSDENPARYHSLGSLEQFPKNYLKVKSRKAQISLLLSQEFCGAVDVLLENREDAGVPVDNLYLFGKPERKDEYYTTKEAEDHLKISMNKSKAVIPIEIKSEASKSSSKTDDIDPDVSNYLKNIKRAFDHHTNRMLELTDEVRSNFSNQSWIELNKCALTCLQLSNDKTYTEVIQYLLLLDYGHKKLVDPDEDFSVYNSLVNTSRQYFKLTMRDTPITLLLSYEICQALDLLILERGHAKIDEENPYVFACSGNKYNYYRSEGCIGSLPVSDGVNEILALRLKIINDLIKNGSAGIQLWKLLPETHEDLTENTVRVFYYAQSKMIELKYKLEEQFSCEIWSELIRCVLAYAHLLNANSPEDPEKLLIFEYLKRAELDITDEKTSYNSLEDVNDFPENYRKVELEGGGSILLSLDVCETVDLLLKHRHECGVHGLNPYVFGCRGTKMNYLRAHGVLAQVAARCGVKRLKYFKAKKVTGDVEMQEHILDMKDVSKTEWDIMLNKWKMNHGIKPSAPPPSDKPAERKAAAIPRRRWTPIEMEVATNSFETCLTKGYLPSVFQCQQVIAANVELQHRTPEQLKAWVNNQLQKRGKRTRPDGEKKSVRCRWSSTERELVSLYFAYNLAVHTLPSAADCRKVILSHAELANRTPEQVRAWINNQNKRDLAAKRLANMNAYN